MCIISGGVVSDWFKNGMPKSSSKTYPEKCSDIANETMAKMRGASKLKQDIYTYSIKPLSTILNTIKLWHAC